MPRGNVANLKPWSKGVSGNPGGRPRTAHFAHLCRAMLARPVAPEYCAELGLPAASTVSDAMAHHLVRQFLHYNSVPAFRELIRFAGIADAARLAQRQARIAAEAAEAEAEAAASPDPLKTVGLSVDAPRNFAKQPDGGGAGVHRKGIA